GTLEIPIPARVAPSRTPPLHLALALAGLLALLLAALFQIVAGALRDATRVTAAAAPDGSVSASSIVPPSIAAPVDPAPDDRTLARARTRALLAILLFAGFLVA